MKFSALGITLLSLCLNQAYALDNSTSSTIGNPAQMQTPTKSQTDGQAFLAANQKKPGVVTLPDGLQYKVITEGSGSKPTINDVVTVHYVGTLIDGTEFDSSYKRGQPATFPVAGVIAGWTEALQLMKAGSTWELYIPANLAYGERGAPPVIGPNETLIFKVQLIDVKKS
jgi:FKBP-type peptidyl-prolyl cis-trans isomerase FklB